MTGEASGVPVHASATECVLNDEPRSRGLVVAALLALATVLAYANSLGVGFLFDDDEAIKANPTIKDLGSLGQVLRPPKNGSGVTGRPLVNLSLALNHAVGGLNPAGYHATNVALHLVAGLVLYGLVRRTVALPSVHERWRIQPLPFAGFVAAAWLLHPLQTESVTCVIQRTEVLVGLLYLLTLYGFVRSVQTPGSRVWPVVCVGACLLGMASKEVMVSAPLMVLLFDRTFVAATLREAWARRRRLYLGLAATWLVLGMLVVAMGGTRGPVAGLGLGVSPVAYAIKQFEAICRYAWLSVWPHPLNLDYGESLAVHPVAIWGQALLVVGGAVLTVVALWRRHPLGFAGMWFFAILAPSSSVVPLLTQTVAEHRMYLPLAAVLVVMAAVACQVLRAWPVAAGVAVAALASTTAARNHVYRDGERLWRDTIAKSPDNSRAYHNLGVELSPRPGRGDEAIACFRAAVRCKPDDVAALFNLGHLLSLKPGHEQEAIGYFEAALRLDAGHIAARVELAALLVHQPGRWEEALAHYQTALQRQPNEVMALTNLAIELSRLPGRSADALELHARALRLRPADPELNLNYALTLAKFPERAQAATERFEAAIRLRPNFFAAHYNLANHLAALPGRTEEAIAHYRAAVDLHPRHATAHYNLGVLFANMGRDAEAIRHFEHVLNLSPEAADARQILEMLKAGR